jgi:hypothetical protein
MGLGSRIDGILHFHWYPKKRSHVSYNSTPLFSSTKFHRLVGNMTNTFIIDIHPILYHIVSHMLFRNSIVYPIYIRYHHQLCTRLWLQPIISASYISNLRFIMVDPVFFKEKHSYGKRPVSRWHTHSTCWCSTSLCEITRGYIKSLISVTIVYEHA